MLEWVSAGRTIDVGEPGTGCCGSVRGENGRGNGSQGCPAGLRPGAGRPPGGLREGGFKRRGGSEMGKVSGEGDFNGIRVVS